MQPIWSALSYTCLPNPGALYLVVPSVGEVGRTRRDFRRPSALCGVRRYLFSFSTHAEDADFDQQHGIRTQWEQYAGLDGYCLIFDIREIA